MGPKISIITAVFNRAATLEDSLRSVRLQTWKDREHIVIDGGSTDGTVSILERRRTEFSTLISEPDQGIYDALNKGITCARGDVVGFMHADDEFASSTVLEKIAAAFEDSSVGAVYGDLVYVRQAVPGAVVRYWRAGGYSREQLTRGWMPPHPTFYLRRDLYERLGLFDTRYRIAADYEHMLRVLWGGQVRAHYIPEVLVRMRLGGASNVSLQNMLRKSKEDYLAVRSTGVGGVGTVLGKNVNKLPQFLLRAPKE